MMTRKIGNKVYFVERGKRKLLEMGYDFNSEKFLAKDTTIHSEHITGESIKEFAYQQSPFNQLWCVSDDGHIALMKRLEEQKTQGWTKIITDGDFESVAVIAGKPEDLAIYAIDEYTLMLLHMNGTDGSVIFIDATGRHTLTAGDNAQIDTATSKFGGGSGLFDGTDDNIFEADTALNNADFRITSGSNPDRTLDFWVKFNTHPSNGGVMSLYSWGRLIGTSSYLTFDYNVTVSGQHRLTFSAKNLGIDDQIHWNISALSLNIWYHLALEIQYNDAGQAYAGAYINAILQGKLAFNQAALPTSGAFLFSIGSSYTTEWFFNGWLDEYRLSNILRYNFANFTLPELPYS